MDIAGKLLEFPQEMKLEKVNFQCLDVRRWPKELINRPHC